MRRGQAENGVEAGSGDSGSDTIVSVGKGITEHLNVGVGDDGTSGIEGLCSNVSVGVSDVTTVGQGGVSMVGSGFQFCCLGGAGMVMFGETGTNCRRNLRFRVVTLPEPSILTEYLSWSKASVTVPVLSQRLGLFPIPFCTKHLSPLRSGRS